VTLLGQGVGLGDPQRSLPTPARLGFRVAAARSLAGRCFAGSLVQLPLQTKHRDSSALPK